MVVPSQVGFPEDLGSENIKALPTHEFTHPYAFWLKPGLEFQDSLGHTVPWEMLTIFLLCFCFLNRSPYDPV